ncbi:MAG TPA: hypothetical protein QF700_11490 [Prochlorococcus sp.]|nr:hypothetical protein [Prochlorococcus sp.]
MTELLRRGQVPGADIYGSGLWGILYFCSVNTALAVCLVDQRCLRVVLWLDVC